jgi:hypothetical protein
MCRHAQHCNSYIVVPKLCLLIAASDCVLNSCHMHPLQTAHQPYIPVRASTAASYREYWYNIIRTRCAL